MKTVISLLAKGPEVLAQALIAAMPANTKIVRLHTSGDFFNADYIKAWFIVMESLPQVKFYAYTKSIHLFNGLNLPANFSLTASVGGRYDSLIEASGLQFVRVVFSRQESRELFLPIDNDDTHAALGLGNFSLLLHGVQEAGSDAAKALKAIKQEEKEIAEAQSIAV